MMVFFNVGFQWFISKVRERHKFHKGKWILFIRRGNNWIYDCRTGPKPFCSTRAYGKQKLSPQMNLFTKSNLSFQVGSVPGCPRAVRRFSDLLSSVFFVYFCKARERK